MTQDERYTVHLPVFEGPLDLLLHLIEREVLDITRVALAQVTDQYMAYLKQLEQANLGDVASFLTIAARLLQIKSEALLPRPPAPVATEEEDSADELIRQLKVYKRFKEVAALLGEREAGNLRSYVRVALPPRLDPQLDMEGVTLDRLLAAVYEALQVLPAPPVDSVVAPAPVSVSDQIARIEAQFVRRPAVRFREVLSQATTRVEIIVTLLAVLELIKQGRAVVRQDGLFGEIVIEPVPAPQ